jgi:hypothetical protein
LQIALGVNVTEVIFAMMDDFLSQTFPSIVRPDQLYAARVQSVAFLDCKGLGCVAENCWNVLCHSHDGSLVFLVDGENVHPEWRGPNYIW